MAWRDREGWLNFVFCDDRSVEDEKEGDGDDDENDVEDTSGYEKLGLRVAWLGIEDLVLVGLHAGSGLVPALSAMDNWLAQEIL